MIENQHLRKTNKSNLIMTPIIISTNTLVLKNDTLSMFWPNVFNHLNKVSKLKPQRGETKEGKKGVQYSFRII